MKRITARFYRTATGGQPIKDWLLSLPADDRRIVGIDIAKVEFGWPVGMPVCAPLGNGLWEVRSTIARGKVEARTYFAVEGGDMILLAAHSGKDRQDRTIDLALERWKDYRRRRRSGQPS